MKKIRIITKYICVIASVIGFILVLGTAGASDLESIPVEQILTQSLVGMALFVLGFAGHWTIKGFEWEEW